MKYASYYIFITFALAFIYTISALDILDVIIYATESSIAIAMMVLMTAITAMYWSMMMDKNKQALKAVELEKEVADVKNQALRAQIKPHFIFNCMSSIQNLYRESISKGDEAMVKFSRHLRTNVDADIKGNVPFEQEIKNILNYVDLEQIRSDKEINLMLDINYWDFVIPVLSMQPLVENAIKYSGVTGREDGYIQIKAYKEDNVVVEVIDNGCGFDVLKVSESSVGLRNAKERLSIALHADMQIVSEKDVGTTIIIIAMPSIGRFVFYNCSGLTSITIPNSVTSIEYQAFVGCSGLTSITIPDGVTSIGQDTFYGCSGLTSITIPNSVTSIEYQAFFGCSGLTSVTIGSGVTSIDGSAFSNCYKLVEVYNKSSLRITAGSSNNGQVGYYAKAVYTSAYTSKLSTDANGCITYTDGDDIILIGYSGTATQLILPNNITGIYQYAFKNYNGLTSITIPNSVTSIGEYAFSGCSGLTSITIPNGVTSIGEYAFSGCSGLTSITIPNGVTSIGEYAFSGCSGLTSITIPNSVTSIGDYAFSGCSGLTSVTFVENSQLTSIGDQAFYCSGLTSITIPSSVTSIGNYAFYNCYSLTSITIPSSVTSIGKWAFWGCSVLASITFADTTTWYRTNNSTNWSNKTGGTQTSVTSASTNATNFTSTSTYVDYCWYKL